MAEGSKGSTEKKGIIKQIIFSIILFVLLVGIVYTLKSRANQGNLKDEHLLSTVIEKNYQGNALMVEAKMSEVAPKTMDLEELTSNAQKLQKANQKTVIYKAVSLLPFDYLEDSESALEEIAVIASNKETLLKITKSYPLSEVASTHIFSSDPIVKNQLDLDDGTLTLHLKLSEQPAGKALVEWCRGYLEAFERHEQNKNIKRVHLEIDMEGRHFRFFSENPKILIEYQTIDENKR